MINQTTCFSCEGPLPRFIPSVAARYDRGSGTVLPDPEGDKFVCLGCVSGFVSLYGHHLGDTLTAQLWLDANNEAWGQLEPQVDFHSHDYRADTV